MRKRKNNFKASFWGERPSDFVVDLKKQLENEIAEPEKRKYNIENIYNLYGKYEKSHRKISSKFKNINIKGFVKKGKEKIGKKVKLSLHALKSTKEKVKKPTKALKEVKIKKDKRDVKKAVSSIIKSSHPQFAENEVKRNSLLQSYLQGVRSQFLGYGDKVNGLAIFSLFKFVFYIFKPIYSSIYKTCYGIGWFIIFIVRFIYFGSLAVISPFKTGLEEIMKYFSWRPILAFRKSIVEIKSRVKYSTKGLIGFITRTKIVKKTTIKSNEKSKKAKIKQNSIETKYEYEYNGDNTENDNFLKRLIPRISKSNLRPMFVFAMTLIILILPFKVFTYYKFFDLNSLKGRVMGASEEAVSDLMSGGQFAGEMNYVVAQKNFSNAASEFLKAQNELEGVSDIILKLASLAPQENVRMASESKNILLAGKLAADLGANLSLAMDSLLNKERGEDGLGVILNNFIVYCEKATEDANKLLGALERINPDNLPEEHRSNFKLAREKSNIIVEGMKEFIDLAKGAVKFLGNGDLKRYLMVFQNNSEMRATGGFIGSYALVDFDNGSIKNIEVPAGGSYDTKGGLNERIISPDPLHLISPIWYFWDANWWPDWPTSSRKLMWFYERSGGPTVDGVISLTPTALENILSVLGPIDMTEEYGVIVTSKNFREITREVIDESNKEYIGTQASSTLPLAGKPKAIIGDLAKKILEEMPVRLNKDVLIGLMKAFQQNLNEKHVLLYFNDEDLENKVKEYGWDGKIRQTQGDYLSVINTNIAGGKSDRKIKESIEHEAEVQSDGSIINTVKITRFHDSLKFVDSSGVRNVNWMRVYVPLGSKLIYANGFESPDEIYFESPEGEWDEDPEVSRVKKEAREDSVSGTKIYEEAGKTVFANWSMVDPGHTAVIKLQYKLPFRFKEGEVYTVVERIKESLNPTQKDLHAYSILFQKQSGSIGSEIDTSLIIPSGMKVIWSYPDNINSSDLGWQVSAKLDTDKYWAAIMEK